MKTVRLSNETMRALKAAANLPFKPEGQQQSDGFWLVPFSDDTWQRLQQNRLPGETDDDVLSRIVRSVSGRKNH